MRSKSSMADDLIKKLQGLDSYPVKKSAGRVLSVNDGVITLEGMNDVRNGELLEFENGAQAMAMNLEEHSVGAILFDEDADVSAGDFAYCTGKVAGVSVGRALLGRVIDPLGNALDGGGKLKISRYRPAEFPAPKIMDRDKVCEPLYTGIKAIDSMIPIGKGQRELIIGDRQTGKTSIALDTIVNQKGKDVICVYVAIGQKSSTITRLIANLKKHDAMSYTVVVASTASQSAPMQYLAPYTGTAIAEDFMYAGKDVLIVYDDLSKHAVAYRTISLLLKRPSGREAYPGDIFYIHSRLLERSAKLVDKLGGGSLTALPIVETLAGDISGYIPTNIISITDGQIYLETDLFNAGMRPAINVGLSVSRVGGHAQKQAIRKQSGQIRLDRAHYMELLLFARFGDELDDETRASIEKGNRMTESLKQLAFHPVDMVDLAIELMLINNDVMKGLEPNRVNDFVKSVISRIYDGERDVVEKISKTGDFDDDDLAIVLKTASRVREEFGL